MTFLPDQTNREFVDALGRGLDVLQTCSDAPEGLTLAEVARRVETTRASARRSLLTLVSKGYLVTDGRLFRLTPKILALAAPMLAAPLVRRTQPVLEELSHRFDESFSIAVISGEEIVYVARTEARRIISLNLTIGSRLPAWCTSMGRILLASLPVEERIKHIPDNLTPRTSKTLIDRDLLLKNLVQVSQDGFALLNEELAPGLSSLAVPIIGLNGRVVAALNVGTESQRTSYAVMMDILLPALRVAADILSASF